MQTAGAHKNILHCVFVNYPIERHLVVMKKPGVSVVCHIYTMAEGLGVWDTPLSQAAMFMYKKLSFSEEKFRQRIKHVKVIHCIWETSYCVMAWD